MTIGIVGAGQLGQMLALAGYPLGFDFLFLDRSVDVPAGRIAPVLTGEMNDPVRLAELARRSEVVSFDWENVDVGALRQASRGTRLAPPLRALATAQDRLLEKKAFDRLSIPTTRHAAVNSKAQLQRAVQRVGLPGVLKTRRLGYDGKGQYVIRALADIDRAWESLGKVPLLYEEFVPFQYEVSIIGVRARSGAIATYPLNRNYHVDGILRLTLAPWRSPAIGARAATHLRRVLEAFNYVGVLTIEYFVRHGQLIANEMAPRVHNSGHWTIEGAVTSQFENHVRAIAGLPLGDPSPRGHAAMINLIGTMPKSTQYLKESGLHWHDYGKEPRHGRKLGHCTLIEPSAGRRNVRAPKLLARLYPQLSLQP
jgi:5-(carboxyamino)imidazole ribonucleotide synthase